MRWGATLHVLMFGHELDPHPLPDAVATAGGNPPVSPRHSR